MQYALAIQAQGFCVLKIIITQFPDGFRLNTFGSFGDGSVQVDVFLKNHLFFLKSGLDYRVLLLEYCHILMTRKYLASHAGRSIQCFRTRKNKKDFFFFTQNESEQFLLALGGVWTKTKPRKYNQEFHTPHDLYSKAEGLPKIRQTEVVPINIRAFRVRTLHIHPLRVK